jgi:hypothetical protein
LDAEGAAVQHVGVDLCRRDVGVAQQILDRAYVVAAFEQMRCEGVAEAVAGDAFVDSGALRCRADGFLQAGLVDVMAMDVAGQRVAVGSGGREEPLPLPFARGVREFKRQGVGERHVAGVGCEVALMKGVDASEVIGEWADEVARDDGVTILAAFAVAQGDAAALEVDVFDA